MEREGSNDQGECAGPEGVIAPPPTSSVNENDVVSVHTKSEYAQDVRGSAHGPVRGNEAPPQIDAALVMEMFNAFQDRLDNMEARMGRQSVDHNPPVTPPVANLQP